MKMIKNQKGALVALSALLLVMAVLSVANQAQAIGLRKCPRNDCAKSTYVPDPATWCHTFNTNLLVGSGGPEVTALQIALEDQLDGYPLLTVEPTVFGAATKKAVIAFQNKYASEVLTPVGLTYGNGAVRGYTRAKLNQLYGCQPVQASSVQVALDSSSPAAQTAVMGTAGYTLGVFRFTATTGNGEAVKIMDLTVTDSVSPAGATAGFQNVGLYNGGTEIVSAPAGNPVAGGYGYVFHLVNPVIIPASGSVSLSVKGDAAVYIAGVSTDGAVHTFGVYAGAVNALGATSNVTVPQSGAAMAAPITVTRTSGGTPPTVTSTLTASLTVTPSVVVAGQPLTYTWASTNAASWRWTLNIFKTSDSSHTVSADACGNSTSNWPGPPGGLSASGSWTGATAMCQAGYTYNFMYTANLGPSTNNILAASAQASVYVVTSTTPMVTSTTPSVRVLSPNGGETLVQGQSNTISWSGGNQVVEIGIVDGSANMQTNFSGTPNLLKGWISTTASPSSSLTWDARKTCDLIGTTCWPLPTGSYKVIAVTKDNLGNLIIGGSAWDLSDNPFTITALSTPLPPAPTNFPITIPQSRPDAINGPRGSLDVLSCSVIAGWTCDPNDYSLPVSAFIYRDGGMNGGVLSTIGTANLTRETAVGTICGGNPAHGFSIATPISLKDGAAHSVYVYASNIGLGANTLLGGGTVTCSAATAANDNASASETASILQALSGLLSDLFKSLLNR